MKNNFVTSELKDCLNRNSRPGTELGNDLESLFSSVRKSEKLLPVVGTQGMGKSTLINAILGEDILPNAADETTCVPVEVAYGEKEYAEVFFRDSDNRVVANTKLELNAFVDNNENPANEKGVEHIRLYRNREILKSGLIIVDLPGVGSITAANEDTTKRYIENVRCAIFVIPTVPVIRRREAMFIKAAWSQFNNAIFVQNDFGETATEKRDSLEFNTLKLKQMSEENALNFEKPILMINAHKALAGAVQNNRSDIDDSGINILTSKITLLANEWDTSLANALTERAKSILILSISEVNRKLKEADSSEEKTRAERREEYDKNKAEIDRVVDTIDNISLWLSEQRPLVKRKISDEAAKTAGTIRAGITNVINSGTVDGSLLEEAFNDIQADEVEAFSLSAQDTVENLANEFREKMLDLIEEIQIQEGLAYDNVNFKSDEKLKWEKGVNYLAQIGGAAGAYYGAGVVAAALMSNPAGWAVALVGVGIYAVASLLGFGVKKYKLKKRKEAARKAIYPKIDEIERMLRKMINLKLDEFFKEAETQLEKLRTQKKEELCAMRYALNAPVHIENKTLLEEDLKILTTAVESL